ncbi:MAG: GNAT family N-acetyltransferase [Candidatus Dormibacteria bacterium]
MTNLAPRAVARAPIRTARLVLQRTFNNHDEGNMGYWMTASAAGHGYCTEAASAIACFGFETVGLARIELRTAVANIASQRVAEKIGMTREAMLRSGVHSGSDAYLYGMARP